MPRALGLDLGRRMGWALAGPDYLAGWKPRTALEGPRASNIGLRCGTWRLGEYADHDALYLRLWERLNNLHAEAPLTIIFFEASGGNYKSEDAIWIQIGLAAVIRLWARLNELDAEKVNNSKVKSHAAHYGAADKSAMIAAAERLGWKPDSEHAADALFILDVKLTEWHRQR